MFDFIANSVRTVANVVTLPVSVVADAVTLGGELTGRRECYTATKAKRVSRDLSELLDDIAG